VTIDPKVADTFWVVVALFAAAAVVIIGPIYGLRYVLNYSVTSLALEIRLLGLTVYRVRLSDIESVEVIPFAALVLISPSFRRDLFFAQKWNAYRKRVIAIKRRSGLIRGITISPEDPDEFSALIKEAIMRCGERQ